MNERSLSSAAEPWAPASPSLPRKAGYEVDLVEPEDAARERALARIYNARRNARRARDRRTRSACSEPFRVRRRTARDRGGVRALRDQARRFSRAGSSAADPMRCWRRIRRRSPSPSSPRSLAHPERVLGLHFFNPPAAHEAGRDRARGRRPRDEAIERAYAFVERIGKTAVARRRYAGVHRQSRRASVLSAGDARAAARRRLRRGTRRAGARQPVFAWGRSN